MISDAVVDILVVEDNDSERDSIVESLQSSIQNVSVIAVRNGTEALDFLFSRNIWSNRAGEDPPKLILMDLALPGSDGFSVLGQIRSIEPQTAFTLTPWLFSRIHKKSMISQKVIAAAQTVTS